MASPSAASQVVAVALGLAEDDGAPQRAIAAHKVSHYCRPLGPVAGQRQVLHACGRLQRR